MFAERLLLVGVTLNLFSSSSSSLSLAMAALQDPNSSQPTLTVWADVFEADAFEALSMYVLPTSASQKTVESLQTRCADSCSE